MCSDKGIPITNFWKDDLPLHHTEAIILFELTMQIGWKRNRKVDLLKRIRRIGRRQSYSVRETKLLRRLFNQQIQKGVFDYEAILEHFPGKTIESLVNRFNETDTNIQLDPVTNEVSAHQRKFKNN